jgi:hypothetical protein
MGFVLFAVLLGGAAGCKMDEATCRSTYGLIKPAECPVVKPPSPPSSPKISIKKKASGNTMHWYAQTDSAPEVEQTVSGSVFPDCKLRDDFIGISMSLFEVVHVNGAIPTAQRVVFENAAMKVEIRKTTLGTVQWTVRDKQNTSNYCSALAPSGTKGGDVIPKELAGFLDTDCHAETGDQCITVTVQFIMP